MAIEKGSIFLRELNKAGARIGRSQVDVMEWLLRFAQQDLFRLSGGDWENLAFELACFVQYGGSHAETDTSLFDLPISIKNWNGALFSKKTPPVESCSPQDLLLVSKICLDGFMLQPSLPARADIGTLQAETKAFLVDFVDKKTTTCLRPTAREFLVYWHDKDPELALVQSLILVDSTHDLFKLHAFKYLKQFIRNLARCPECQSIYLATRSDKKFCSTRCQMRVAMRRSRNVPPERKGKTGRPKGSTKQQSLKGKKSQPTKGRRAK